MARRDGPANSQALSQNSGSPDLLVSALEHQSQPVIVYEADESGLDFYIRYVNRAAEKVVHRERDDLLGRRLSQAFPAARDMGLVDLCRRVHESGEAAELPETPYRDENVSGWYVNEIARLPCGRLIVTFRDVTAEVEARTAKERSERAYRSMVEQLSEGMLLLEGDRIVSANRAASRMLGAARAPELPGKALGSFVIEKDESALQLALHSLDRNAPAVAEVRTRSESSSPTWLRATFRKDESEARGGARCTVLLEDISAERLIQERVQQRLAAISTAEAGVPDLELAEILDMEAIQALLDTLYEATGLPSAILDLEDRALSRSGWHEACSRFHRTHPVSCQRCRESDARIRDQLPESGHLAYECGNGLWDFAFPIRAQDRHVATFFFGQVFLAESPPDEERFRRQAEECGFDIESYLQAIRRVPLLPRDKVDKIMRFCASLVEHLTLTASKNLSQASSLARLHKAEAELEQHRRLFTEAERLVGLGAFSLNLNSDSFWATREWHRIHGTKGRTLNWKDLSKLAHPEDLPRIESALDGALRAGARYDVEHRIIRADNGETRWVHAIGEAERDEEGRVTGLIGVGRDITKERAAAEERRRIEESMQRAQRLESLGLLAGGIAHDFNNLLAVVLGNAELLSNCPHSEGERAEQVRAIIQAADTGSGLTKQLLAYAGQAPAQMEGLSLGELIEEMRELLTAALRKGLSLELQVPAAPLWVKADRSQLRQVLLNLVINASEATVTKRGEVSVRAGSAVLEDEERPRLVGADNIDEGPMAYLEVLDRGEGMSEETRRRIFEPFFTTKFQGHGLGMAAVLGIARAHGGALRVRGREGGGSAVRLYLPLDTSEAHREHDAEQQGTLSSQAHNQALIIDDESAVRRVAERMFRKLGLDPVSCASGEEGLALAGCHRSLLCVVLLDYTMPGLSGVETLERLRARHPKLPVIMASGFREEQVMEGVEADPHSVFLQKPFRMASLRSSLERLGVITASSLQDDPLA